MDIASQRKYFLKKLAAIEACLDANRNAQERLAGVLDTVKPKLAKVNEAINEYFDQRAFRKRNVDFYNKNLPLFANNKIKMIMEKLSKESSDAAKTCPQEFKQEVDVFNDECSENCSDYTISSQEDESDFEWDYLPNTQKPVLRARSRLSYEELDDSDDSDTTTKMKVQLKCNQYTKPRRSKKNGLLSKSAKNTSKTISKRPSKAELLKINWRRIEEHFHIDYVDLRKNNYESIAERLNNTDYLLSTEEPIFGLDVYKQIVKIYNSVKSKSVKWSEEEKIKLIGLIDLIGVNNWKQIDVYFHDKSAEDCLKAYLDIRGSRGWTFADDIRLIYGVIVFNFSWVTVSTLMFMKTKSQQQARERFANVLDPVLARENPEIHDIYLASFYKVFGYSWTWIMTNKLPHTTDNKLLRDVQLFKKKYIGKFAEQTIIADWLKRKYNSKQPLFSITSRD